MSEKTQENTDILKTFRGELWKQALGIVLSGVLLLGGAATAFYVRTEADRARAEEVHRRLERDVEHLQRDQREAEGAFDDLRGDVRALKAAYDRGQSDTQQRLIRIEGALDNGPRRRR